MPSNHVDHGIDRPAPFSISTVEELWTDDHTSKRMLEFHLDGDVALASGTTEFIAGAFDWISGRVGLGDGSTVLDLGCGPGLYANRFAAAGAAVVGVDFSERSLRHARATADPDADATYLHGNYLEVEVDGAFDLILLAMYDYCAIGPDQRRHLLRRIRDWLEPDGRFVFDVYAIRSLAEREESETQAENLMDGFWSAEPYHGSLRTLLYPDERVGLDLYEIVESGRTRTIYNWLQYFDTDTLNKELATAGLEIDQLVGDLTGAPLDADPHHFGVVAKLAH